MIRSFSLLLTATLSFAAMLAPGRAVAAGSAPVQTDHLRSRLVAETTAAVPGTRLMLGLLLEHDPHWHTYWRNPGDSGLPTKIELTLPEGVAAEPIAWPHPQRFEVAGIVNFGYGGRRLLPVMISLPADYAAPTLPVRAKASWLICEEECIPGQAEYALELPIAAASDPDPQFQDDFAAARTDQPRESAATLSIAEDGDAMLLSLDGLDAAAMPVQWQWFPEIPEIFANGAHPQWQRAGEGWRARWARSEYFTALPADVALVAVEDEGVAWRFVARVAAPVAGTTATPASATPPAAAGVAPEPTPWPTLLYIVLGVIILTLLSFALRRRL